MAQFGMALSWGNPKLAEVEGWCGKLDFLQGHGGAANWNDFQSSLAGTTERTLQASRTPHLSQPLWAGSGSLQNAARGDYDGYWRTTAQNIKNRLAGRPGPFVCRLGVEWNGSWMPWRATNQTDAKTYATAFRRMATIFKAEIPNVLIDFNFNRDAVDPRWGYPGDDVVDILSIDFYFEQQWSGSLTGKQFFDKVKSEPVGLDFLKNWAAERKKPWAWAEIGFKSVTDQQGADWCNMLTDYLAANGDNCAYVSYFNEPWNGGSLNKVELTADRPLSRTAIKRMASVVRSLGSVPPVTQPPANPPTEDLTAIKQELSAANARIRVLEQRINAGLAALGG